MKSVIEVSAEDKKRLMRWALKNDRVDMWNEKGIFCSAKVAAYMFRVGLEAEEKKS